MRTRFGVTLYVRCLYCNEYSDLELQTMALSPMSSLALVNVT